MSNPALFFDDWENKPLAIPVSNCAEMALKISTRNYNAVVVGGDGTLFSYVTSKNVDTTVNAAFYAIKQYSPNFTGDIKVYLKGGLKDVYSYSFSTSQISKDFHQYFNIQNLGLFLAQMPNLYSYTFDIYAYGVANKQPTIIGDFAQSPDSVRHIYIGGVDVKNRATALVLNFNNFKNTSKLKWFRKVYDGVGSSVNSSLRFIGDIAKIPPLCQYFFIDTSTIQSTSAITYTSGKVWASSFDTLHIPIQLTTSELDNLLIDMDNSITTKIGDGFITLYGYRSSISDTAVASLQSKGFTVNVNRVLNNVSNVDASLLRLDFQNNFDVYSNSGLNIVTGGNSNPPTFALSGRKPGEYCAVFNGSQSIKTTTNLPINSDKVTIAFWIKKNTQPLSGMVIYETGNSVTSNLFAGVINENGNSFLSRSRNSGINENKTDTPNNTWIHIITVIDRSENGNNEIKTYVNGALAASTKPNSVDNNGNFLNDILYIGQRAGSEFGFIGSLTRLKIYNYPFTPSEVTNLYNSEL